MDARETVKTILRRWNEGKREEAKKLLSLSQWSLPVRTRDALKLRMGLTLKHNVKIDKTLKMCCDKIGGKITEKGIEIYKN